MFRSKYWPWALISLILIVDQASKLLVNAYMPINTEFNVLGDWFRIHYLENNGMAFGIEFGGEYGKLFLTLFRLVAVSILGWYIIKLQKTNATTGAIACFSMILAGAAGNIIDSVAYGVYFGYADWFHGRVIDMFYFPIWSGVLPNWIPVWGGTHMEFFQHVFNFADFSISTGVITMLVFNKRFFPEEANKNNKAETNSEELV